MIEKSGGRCWGIFRERAHSPGRESDDELILRAAGAELVRLGFDVEYRTPEELDGVPDAAAPPNLFVMCERVPIVDRLARWETSGATIVNAPSGIRNTDRDRTIALFRKGGVPFPRSVLVGTGKNDPWPGVLPPFPVWVKRADVHATQEGDVSFAESPAVLARTLGTLAEREIRRAVIQEHVPGDLIKFYGIGRPAGASGASPWFRGFYHKGQKLQGHPWDENVLSRMAFGAAESLGLDVFGGDAIAGPGGRLVIIDLNAWPSFALYRAEAAPRIAAHLSARFRKETGVIR